MPRVVCQSCKEVLEPGDPKLGTKFKTCTACMHKKLPGADNSKILDAHGRRIQKSEPKKLKNQYEMDLQTDYVMVKGSVLVQFLFNIKGLGSFDMGLTEEQINRFATEMKEIREKAERDKIVRDALKEDS